MSETEFKHCLCIPFETKEDVAEFLENWDTIGFYGIVNALIVSGPINRIRGDILEAMGNCINAVLIDLTDMKVVAWDFREMTECELITDGIIVEAEENE